MYVIYVCVCVCFLHFFFETFKKLKKKKTLFQEKLTDQAHTFPVQDSD